LPSESCFLVQQVFYQVEATRLTRQKSGAIRLKISDWLKFVFLKLFFNYYFRGFFSYYCRSLGNLFCEVVFWNLWTVEEVNKGQMFSFLPLSFFVYARFFLIFFFIVFLLISFPFSPSMEGYSTDGKCRDFGGRTWSQNSKWMKFFTPFTLPQRYAPSRIAQV